MALKYVVFRGIMDQVTGTRGQGEQIASLSGHQNKVGNGEKKRLAAMSLSLYT